MLKRLSPREKLERLRAHAESLHLWEHAHGHHCGPRTAEGKRRSALRALKHGLRSEGGHAMAAWLKGLNRMLAEVMER